MKHKSGRNALVTGATGIIGPYLVKELVYQGYKVRALYRNHHNNKPFSDTVELMQCDITDGEALKNAVKNIDVIFHLAAKLHINDPSPDLQRDYERVNIEGTRQLVQAAQSEGVQRFVYFSTINVYGPSSAGIVHDEYSPAAPLSLYAKSKAKAEEIVSTAMPSVILRLAAVYGPRMKGNYLHLLNALKNRCFVMIGNGRNRRTLVHIQDVCQATILAANASNAVGRVYNVTDGEIHTLQEIVAAMGKAVGKNPPKFSLPAKVVRPPLGWIEDICNRFNRKAPVGRFTVDKLIEDIAVNADRIKAELDYQPKFDLETGWRECARSMFDESG